MVYLDDSIMEEGKIASAGSKMLANFTAPFDATAVTRLGGGTARAALGEFGLEAPTEPLKAPMLANDVFGHVRAAAAKQGLCYIRPTYGTVSRFGLVPTASSMDQIGVVCENPEQGFELLSRVAGKDGKDGAMLPEERYDYGKTGGAIRFGIPEGISLPGAEKLGAVRVKLPYTDVYEPVLTILAYSEISNNISRYDGVKFGYRASGYASLGELYTKSRAEGFGLPAKLAAIMGSMLLSEGYYEKYYVQAMRLRRLIKESIRFDDYDALLLPAGCPLAVLAGLPSVSFDGMELVAGVCCEGILRSAWEVAAR